MDHTGYNLLACPKAVSNVVPAWNPTLGHTKYPPWDNVDPWLGQYWNNLVQFHLSYLPLEHNVVPTLLPKLGTY